MKKEVKKEEAEKDLKKETEEEEAKVIRKEPLSLEELLAKKKAEEEARNRVSFLRAAWIPHSLLLTFLHMLNFLKLISLPFIFQPYSLNF